MKKVKKALLMSLSFVLVVALAIAGTVAYLTDTDSEANVMTLGNVTIQQNEWQRAEGVGHINDKATGAQEGDLVPFDQNQPIYPAVKLTEDATQAEQSDLFYWGEYAPGGNGLWNEKELANVRDKIVMVTNTGKTDAYFRTLVAFECPDNFNGSLIKFNANTSWYNYTRVGFVYIDSVRYYVMEYVYKGDTGSGAGVLAPKETARPSLLQVYIDSTATNEDMEKLGGSWEILVLSQAVQAEGFANAGAALNEAFGVSNAENVPLWFGSAIHTVEVDGTDKAAVLAAIEEAKDGDTVKLTDDIVIAGYASTNKLVIDKAIVLDLNGNTITTECGWGGIDAKGGCSIINGTINHTGNTAAIKAFNVELIENVTINVTKTDGKVKGGIVVQNVNSYVGSIKNVTINGATNGIECYNNSANPAIGSMTNVKIDATANGIYLNGGGVLGTITDCTIKAGDTGIRGDLKGVYSIKLDIVNSDITGEKYGVDLWDETPSNPGTVTFNYDADTSFSGATYDIKITLNDEVACTYQNETQSKPCSILIQE